MLSLVANVAQAGSRTYAAPLETAAWKVQQRGLLECALEHQIPFFGTARFVQEAGRKMHLELHSEHRFKASTLVRFLSENAPWSDTQIKRPLAQVRIASAQPLIKVSADASRRAYFDLRDGLEPNFYFKDPQDDLSQTRIRLSTARFRATEAAFQACVTQLYPQHYDDVSSARIFFGHDSEFPLVGAEEVLEPLLEYLKVDKGIQEIRLTGLTDATGRACYNRNLAQRRVDYVRDWLELSGVDPALIRERPIGEVSASAARQVETSAPSSKTGIIAFLGNLSGTRAKKPDPKIQRDPGSRVVIVEMIR